jgi:hypothetical protein
VSFLWKKLAPSLLIVFSGFVCTQAQTENEKLTIILKGDRPLIVDEVSESTDGYWYKRGNITTFLDRERVVRVEYPKPPTEEKPAQPLEGTGKWRLADAQKIQDFFLARFKKPLPTTAFGQSDLHTRWGLDHRNGIDVGLHPDSTEGRALIEFLRSESIPFLAFRGPVPGVATGPHIHIGNRSPRVSGR